ncbi:hypothetical protein CR152_01880 [Massilia violaceinigra]|uniref:DUF4926 domain-containing protein n=1 Tax=Massilia violaceinigra TaxID=2045208 RepID=A0A2D2DEI7_9BURK|nr:hypothetical protein [Massilia violaceinigra]ATQ73396.1 hypothetical protein CR152_01880 [Massilia violaceinigra]
MKSKQYAVVRLKGFNVQMPELADECHLRQPRVGDVATIVEIYLEPAGYELECSDGGGITQWLMAFGLGDVELELVQ